MWANVTRAGLKWRFVCLCSVQTKQRAVSSKLPVRLVEFLHTANGQNYLARNRKAEAGASTISPSDWAISAGFSRHTGRIVQCHEEPRHNVIAAHITTGSPDVSNGQPVDSRRLLAGC